MKARVLTFNTLFRGHSRARIGALGRLLENSSYDVVCLQEVMSPANLALLRRTARSFTHVVHGATFPLVRGGLVILSRAPVVHHRFRAFTFAGPARKEWVMRKGMLMARVRFADRTVTILNTHLSANMNDDWSPSNAYAKAQRSELDELAAFVARLGPADPLIVLGDFNVPRGSDLLRDFAATAGLHDVLEGDTEPTFRPTPEYSDTKPLDQIFTRPAMAATTRLVFHDEVPLPDGRSMYLSDHFGIEATFA
ncbi:endonuclease/exonuclease/phosphatase family protein [Actinomadura sp. SCN-SB]|uniref:endonuclease/exonuclease/phosphatase family protein n=1 Tax=Actinomadura sp. SCN-SB TaxID=3373092 RepID=UPI003751C757